MRVVKRAGCSVRPRYSEAISARVFNMRLISHPTSCAMWQLEIIFYGQSAASNEAIDCLLWVQLRV
jgi:hypothetical protein